MSDELNQKNPPIDDWSLPPTDVNVPPVENSEDWVMTSPLKSQITETPKDGWKMPDPVFRMSDGYCPVKSDQNAGAQANFKKAPVDETLANLYAPPTPTEDLPDMTMHNISLADLKAEIEAEKAGKSKKAEKPAKPPIEPQPNISQEFNIQTVATEAAPAKKERSERARLILVIVGIAAMILFAVGFLALIYFLFFSNQSFSNFLN
jgi:hypothetical protein